MNSENFSNILRKLPSTFNINRFTDSFDTYIVYLSKDQLEIYNRFIESKCGWNEFYMKLFPGQPFPKDYDKFLEYNTKKRKKRQWFVASLFR